MAKQGGSATELQVFFVGLAAHVPEGARNGAFTTLLVDHAGMPPMHDMAICMSGVQPHPTLPDGPLAPGRYDVEWVGGTQIVNGTTTASPGKYDPSTDTLTGADGFNWLPTLKTLINDSVHQKHLACPPPQLDLVKAQIALPDEGVMQVSNLVYWEAPGIPRGNVSAVAWQDQAGQPLPQFPAAPMAEGMVFVSSRSGTPTVKITHTDFKTQKKTPTTLTPLAAGGAMSIRFENRPRGPFSNPPGTRLPVAGHFKIFYQLATQGVPATQPVPVCTTRLIKNPQFPSRPNTSRCGPHGLSPLDPPICPQLDD